MRTWGDGWLSQKKTEHIFWEKTEEEHWWTGNISSLEHGRNKTPNKTDVDKYINLSIWVNAPMLKLLSAPLLFQLLLTHVLPTKTCIP